MATVTAGYNWVSGEVVTPAKLISTGTPTISNIANADIKSDAAIAGTKISPNFGVQQIQFGADDNLLYQSASNTVSLRIGSSTNQSFLDFEGRSGVPTIDGQGGALAFASGNTERMRIDGNGNVGIGTTTPAYRLHVETSTAGLDGVRFVNLSSSASAVTLIQIGNNTNAAAGALELTSGANTTAMGGANALVLRNGLSAPVVFGTAGNERMRVKSTGQVRFVPLSADPAGAESGDVYYNSATNKLRVYDGTSWVDLH